MPVVKDLASLTVAMTDLKPYYRNPRKGDVDALVESLKAHGQYRPIVVNRGTKTDRPNEIAAGNHTYHAAKKLKWKKIAATWIDVDDDTLSRIVLVDNRTSDLGEYYDRELADMLEELHMTGAKMAGSGYTEMDAKVLLERLGEPEAAASFLDSFTGKQPTRESLIWTAEGKEMVKLQFMLTVTERHTVLTALEVAKTIIDSTAANEALVYILTDWMTAHAD